MILESLRGPAGSRRFWMHMSSLRGLIFPEFQREGRGERWQGGDKIKGGGIPFPTSWWVFKKTKKQKTTLMGSSK